MANKKVPVKFCITSGKGGVGKTSVTVNLAYALAARGVRVLVVDGDLGLANVDVILGLSVQKTLRDVLEGDGRGDVLDAVVYVEPNFGVLPANSGVPEMADLGPEEQEQMGEILSNIAAHFDIVLIDTAAGIGASVLWFNNFVEFCIVIITADPTSMTDAYALMKILSKDYDRDQFHLIMNLVASEGEGKQVFDTISKVSRQYLGVHPHHLATVLQDKAVVKAVRERKPFVKHEPRSKAAQAITALAARVAELARLK